MLERLTPRGSSEVALTTYFVIQRAATNVLLILSTTLFLARAGVGKLPFMYVLMNVVAIGIQVWGAAYPNLSSYRLLRRLSLAMVALTLAAPVVLTTAGPALVIAAVFGLQIAARVFEIMSGTLFLNIVGEIYPLRESKEKIPRLLTAASASTIVSGLLVKPVTRLLSVEGTIALFGLVLLVGQVSLYRIGRLMGRVGARAQGSSTPTAADEAARVAAEEACAAGPAFAPAGGAAAAPGASAPPRAARAGWSRLFGRELVRSMTMVAFLVSFLKFLQDFQYSAAVADHYRDSAALAAFLGYYESGSTVLIITAQAFLTARLIRRLKLGVVVALLPAVMVVTSLAAALSPTLWTIVAAKILYTILSNGFYNPAGSLLVGPLEPDSRDRARLAVSTSTSAGCLCVGVALQLGLKSMAPETMFLSMAALYGVALLLARRLDRAYLDELRQELSGTDSGRRLENVQALRVVSGDYAAERLLELLADPDPEVRQRSLREVAFLEIGPARRVLEFVLTRGSDARLRASALGELVGVLGEEAIALGRAHLADPDLRIQANALEAVAAVRTAAAADLLRPYLHHANHRLRAIAATGLLRIATDEAEIDSALGVLARMARDPDPLMRASAAVAFGELAFPFFRTALISLVADRNEQVFSAAVRAIVRLRALDAVPVLARLAGLPGFEHRAERLAAACETLEDRSTDELMSVMETLSGEERARLREQLAGIRHSVRAQVLKRALSLKSKRARQGIVAYLHRATHAGAPTLVAECLAEDPPTIGPALAAMRSGDHRGEGAIARLLVGLMDAANARRLREYLEEVWERVRATLALSFAQEPGSAAEAALARRRARLLAHGFALVGLLSRRPREVVETLEKALEGDRFVASLSMELVATRIGREAATSLLPLLETLRTRIAREAEAAPGLAQAKVPSPEDGVRPEVMASEAERLAAVLATVPEAAVPRAASEEEEPAPEEGGYDSPGGAVEAEVASGAAAGAPGGWRQDGRGGGEA